ncbi:hypothetical protein PR048_009226 [Dryococelus australis]|uniref:Chitin-binding type-2 domain-containing protein n=1 Tax=Dryococelus australis TaxID=614101 RepID=A0ABQ9HZC5_9NEOP|nr:hypothetical protein PR048_009226 [Dryococelus australis]
MYSPGQGETNDCASSPDLSRTLAHGTASTSRTICGFPYFIERSRHWTLALETFSCGRHYSPQVLASRRPRFGVPPLRSQVVPTLASSRLSTLFCKQPDDNSFAINSRNQIPFNNVEDIPTVSPEAGHRMWVKKAPREYYPLGYPNVPNDVTTPVLLHYVPTRTDFHCDRQKYLPGLYADPQIGCRVSMVQRRNARMGETENHRENPPTNDILQHDFHVRKFGSDPTRNRSRLASVQGELFSHCFIVAPLEAKKISPLYGNFDHACQMQKFGFQICRNRSQFAVAEVRNQTPYEKKSCYTFMVTHDAHCPRTLCGEREREREYVCVSQVFHACVHSSAGAVTTRSYSCPLYTLFDQSLLKCNWWFYVDCKTSEKLYDSNIAVAKTYNLVKAVFFPIENEALTAAFVPSVPAEEKQVCELASNIKSATAVAAQRRLELTLRDDGRSISFYRRIVNGAAMNDRSLDPSARCLFSNNLERFPSEPKVDRNTAAQIELLSHHSSKLAPFTKVDVMQEFQEYLVDCEERAADEDYMWLLVRGIPWVQKSCHDQNVLTEKQFNVGTRRLVVRSQRERSTSSLVYGLGSRTGMMGTCCGWIRSVTAKLKTSPTQDREESKMTGASSSTRLTWTSASVS